MDDIAEMFESALAVAVDLIGLGASDNRRLYQTVCRARHVSNSPRVRDGSFRPPEISFSTEREKPPYVPGDRPFDMKGANLDVSSPLHGSRQG